MDNNRALETSSKEESGRKPMIYIKNTDIIGQRETKRNYYQQFLKDNFSTVAKTPIMALVNNGTVDNEDIQIIEYIYTARFSTIDQIERFCDSRGIEETRSRITNLLGVGMINAFFIMGSGKPGNYIAKPSDAKLFYCLKQGGKYILDEYSDRLFIQWEAGDNLTSIKNIESQIMLNETYLDMITSKVQMISFEPKPVFSLREEFLRCNAYYGFVDANGINEYMIFDTIRKEDNIDNIRKKIRMWEGLLCTRVWMRYFNDTKKIPMLVFITDNDDLAFTLAQNIVTGSKLNIFLITTFERIRNRALGDDGRFIKYNKEDGKLYEISYNLFG